MQSPVVASFNLFDLEARRHMQLCTHNYASSKHYSTITVLVLLPGESHEYYDPMNTMLCYSFYTTNLLQYYYYCATNTVIGALTSLRLCCFLNFTVIQHKNKQTKKCLIQNKILKNVSLSVQKTNKRPKLFYTG